MEKDGITRVFIKAHSLAGGDVDHVVPLWPENEGQVGARLGDDARAVEDRADAFATRYAEFTPVMGSNDRVRMTREGFNVELKSGDETFVDQTGGPVDEKYEDLATSLEDHTGMTGLTILVTMDGTAQTIASGEVPEAPEALPDDATIDQRYAHLGNQALQNGDLEMSDRYARYSLLLRYRNLPPEAYENIHSS